MWVDDCFHWFLGVKKSVCGVGMMCAGCGMTNQLTLASLTSMSLEPRSDVK